VLSGIVGGLIAAAGFQYAVLPQGFRDLGVSIGDYISGASVGGIIYIAAATIGAFTRLR
jgi:hypothetical protein